MLEPWITPSMFDATGNDAIIDEWTFCQLQSRSAAQASLQNHWNTFYTEADFAAIAAAGCVLSSRPTYPIFHAVEMNGGVLECFTTYAYSEYTS